MMNSIHNFSNTSLDALNLSISKKYDDKHHVADYIGEVKNRAGLTYHLDLLKKNPGIIALKKYSNDNFSFRMDCFNRALAQDKVDQWVNYESSVNQSNHEEIKKVGEKIKHTNYFGSPGNLWFTSPEGTELMFKFTTLPCFKDFAIEKTVDTLYAPGRGLGNNAVNILFDDMNGSPDVVKVDLRYNDITSIPFIDLPGCHTIDMSSNKISNTNALRDLSHLKKLSTIDLGNNNIHSFPDEFVKNLPPKVNVKLSGNNLSETTKNKLRTQAETKGEDAPVLYFEPTSSFDYQSYEEDLLGGYGFFEVDDEFDESSQSDLHYGNYPDVNETYAINNATKNLFINVIDNKAVNIDKISNVSEDFFTCPLEFDIPDKVVFLKNGEDSKGNPLFQCYSAKELIKYIEGSELSVFYKDDDETSGFINPKNKQLFDHGDIYSVNEQVVQDYLKRNM